MSIWRDIPGVPGHRVNCWGYVHGPQRRITPWLQDGYLRVTLRFQGKKINRFVHQLVAEAFLGPRPSPKHQVLHRNGKRNQPWLSNLRWGTLLENQEDKRKHGTFECDCSRKLDERRVKILRRSSNWTRLAAKFGVTVRAARNARTGQTWAHVR